jgi:hypothetical protein
MNVRSQNALGVLALLLFVAGPSKVAGQGTSTGAPVGQTAQDPSLTLAIRELQRLLEALQQRLDAQGREIEALRAELAALRAGQPTVPAAAVTAAIPAPLTPGQEPEQRIRVPELPPDVVSAGEFPGSFKIPGTDAALKIGGLVRVNWVSTNDALLVDDRFATSAIPVEGTVESSRGARVNVIASPSRFNFDLRTPTGVGHMRAFIEGDFAGSGNSLRLRHAYGQWRRWIYGQTWSTFSDPEAEPDGIDFEGLNAIVLFRQPQIRFSFALGERVRLALALEDPNPDLTGATGVNQVPDVVARVRWEPRFGGHIQTAVLTRQLRGEPDDRPNEIVEATGFGFNISGRLPARFWSERDHILFQQNSGSGIGRYITDLGTEGGQDGVYDPNAGTLRTLQAASGYLGYEHWWTATLRSSLTFGIVAVDNLDIQSSDALHYTRRYSVNFMWSPVPRMDLVAEFLAGNRTNKDGRRGSAAQTQIGSTFRF